MHHFDYRMGKCDDDDATHRLSNDRKWLPLCCLCLKNILRKLKMETGKGLETKELAKIDKVLCREKKEAEK